MKSLGHWKTVMKNVLTRHLLGQPMSEAELLYVGIQIRNEAIIDCMNQLGGRYGAAVSKDLRMLIE